MVPVEPFKTTDIVAIAENDSGERKFVRIDSKYMGKVSFGTQGEIVEEKTPFGLLLRFIPAGIPERRKVVMVTGGSRGIGRAVCEKFATHGYRVVLTDILEDEATEATIRKLKELGAEPLFIRMDVSSPKDVSRAKEIVEKEIGYIDVLVNNAGITRDRTIEKMKEEDWDTVMNVNLKGAFLVSREMSELMKKGGGAVINISSIVGIEGNIGQANYAASKAGLVGLSNTLAKELAPYRIRVASIAPGFVDTGMVASVPTNIIKEYLRKLPIPRLIKPEEIASLVYEIAENEAISGVVYLIDLGGSISFPRT